MSASVTATFVFTDLVDSTATAARLGPASAEELRQTHFRLLREAVAASGGVEVKNLGDGLMVMYSSPSQALEGAVAMQQAVDRHNRADAEPLGIRIGVSVGEATEDDHDYFGHPVVEAARLCAAAGGGQVLASEVVRSLMRRGGTHTFADVGPLKLKGIPDPVDVVEVVWEPTTPEATVPLPGRLVGSETDARFGFFGRAHELSVLVDAQKQARAASRCQAVFVAGEPGIGKTALVAAAARSAHRGGAIVLFGHADEDAGISYQPWIEALAGLVRDSAPDLVAGLRPARRGALARLLPEIGIDDDRVADPESDRMLVWNGATELLAAASQRGAVIVVLDDLHWADTASLQLLRHAIGATSPMDVTIICTYRDTDLNRLHPLGKLLADLHREANVARIALGGLGDADLIEMLEVAAGSELDDAGIGLALALRRETDGNPFFTAEMLRHLRESGGIVLGADGSLSLTGTLEELGLPNSVRDVIGRRVERLGPEPSRVLRLASVIGREFDLDLLAHLADVDEEELLDVLEAAVDASLVAESAASDRFRFAHALIQHSLYDELRPARRQRAHQRVAELLEASTPATDDPATLAELAHHWVAATRPADLDRALHYVRRAGDAARASAAPDDAARWYRQALDLTERQSSPDEHERAELLAALGTAQCEASDPEYRGTLLDAAALGERLDRTDVLVQVALGFGLYLGSHVGDEDAKPIIRAALERIGPDPTPTRARLLAKLSVAHNASTDPFERHSAALEAVEAARQAGDDRTFIDVIEGTHLTLATPDRRDRHLADIEQAVTSADRLDDPLLRARVRYPAMWARYQLADLAGADATLGEYQALVDLLGLPYLDWQPGQFTAGRLLLAGRTDEAEVAIEHLLELGTAAGSPDVLGAYGGLLYAIRWQQGRTAEIADFFLDVARENPSIAALRASIPLMLCELGRRDEARELLRDEIERDFDYPFDSLWLVSMANMADAAAITEEQSAARTIVDRLAPFADHVISPAGIILNGAVARPIARAATVLGDHERAERWFAMAHDIHQRLASPYWTALGQLDHADLCLAREGDGDLERARELIAMAATTADEYGFEMLATRAGA
jgi:class 3 adenylate cyclase/tetratricopeptide (TPR) repeat protein